jgi:hypothetical protein
VPSRSRTDLREMSCLGSGNTSPEANAQLHIAIARHRLGIS